MFREEEEHAMDWQRCEQITGSKHLVLRRDKTETRTSGKIRKYTSTEKFVKLMIQQNTYGLGTQYSSEKIRLRCGIWGFLMAVSTKNTVVWDMILKGLE